MKTFWQKDKNPDKRDWLFLFIVGIILLLIMLSMGSCTTERKAVSYLDNHAFAAAKYCAGAFPVRDSTVYKEGQTITKSDTTYLHNDSVACPAAGHTPDSGKLVYVKCPPSRIIHDSIFKTDTVSVIRENTAKTAALTSQLAIITEKQKDVENGRRKWRKCALITWAICFVGIGGFTLTKLKIL